MNVGISLHLFKNALIKIHMKIVLSLLLKIHIKKVSINNFLLHLISLFITILWLTSLIYLILKLFFLESICWFNYF